MIGSLRALWRSASAPRVFFEARSDEEPRPLRSLAVGLASGLVGALVAGWALALATGSDPWIVILATAGLSLPYLVLINALGGLAIVRLGRLDLRAWEITGWSWVPAGFLGVALAPVVQLGPLPALAVGLMLLPAWNIFVVVGGLRAFAPPERIRAASLVYIAVVYLAPALFTGITFWVVSLGVGN